MTTNISDRILASLRREPGTSERIAARVGAPKHDVDVLLHRLLAAGKVEGQRQYSRDNGPQPMVWYAYGTLPAGDPAVAFAHYQDQHFAHRTS